METPQDHHEQTSGVFAGFDMDEVPAGVDFAQGKVRDIFDLGDELLICTTDRISAFDRILGLVPFKGEVLNRLSLFWFTNTEHIIRSHVVAKVSSRATLVRKCHVLPVEVVVRGYLTGGAWRDYQAGRPVSGITLPPGMRFNQQFEQPLVTPSTKEAQGFHDRPVSRQELLDAGVVDPDRWAEIERIALSLYEEGRQLAAERGLILVDTKYEFGMDGEEICLIDELHTPDSSRFWYADFYQELFDAGEKQRKLDKEYLRQWLMERGYQGDGLPPEVPQAVFDEVSARYRRAYETLTGSEWKTQSLESEAEKRKILLFLSERQED
jgi:phosphoribosylaminoimidazole-succinocarboxamide synthase